MTSPVAVLLPVCTWGPYNPRANVLLVHGLTASANAWWRVAARLADEGVRVVAPDLRGHGNAPRTTSYSLVAQAADLLALDGGPWDVVVGHSLAGPIVTTAVAERPGWAKSVLLLDPLFDVDDDRVPLLVDDQLFELDLNANPDHILAANPGWTHEDAFHKAYAARTTSPTTVRGCLEHNRPWHYLPLLTTPNLPPTVVIGADPAVGALFPPELAQRPEVQHVTYRTATGTGHGIHRERPEIVVAEVRGLLDV